MKKLFTTIAIMLMVVTVFQPQQASAQSPEKMSYQAVIRDSDDNLITDTEIGMQISILQGTADGAAVYIETQTPTTNANGLVSIEIGGGAGFNTIDWSAGPYFIETKTDPTGGTNYTITGTSQLLSVPYALHAKSAETVSGGISETDPVFGAWDKSTGITITESQISDLDHFTTADEIDPVFTAWDKSTGISITESQISDLDHFTTADETDPVYGSSVASGITGTDTTNWNNKLDSETDPVFTAWDKSTGISITESQISDLNHFTTADESDPVYGSSVASGITGTDTTNWNNESDPLFSDWDKSTGISITESQISDLDHFTTADETDPVYGSSVASGITGTDTTNWNNKLDSETDPSVPAGTQTGEMQYWNGSEWVNVPAGSSGQILVFVNGKPTWGVQGMVDGDVHNPVTDKVWMDRNLGASQVATASDDPDSYGDLYQWGRAADGHESRTSANYDGDANGKPSTYDESGDWDGKFITTNTSPYDWLDPQDDNLWQGVSGTNNPCPSGYRLPTQAEWEAERQSWSSNDAAGAFGSPLKLPVAGRRSFSNGSLGDVGSGGVYWSSTLDVNYSRGLFFDSIDALVVSYYRGFGSSVRCIKD